jgi:hypothetical protein
MTTLEPNENNAKVKALLIIEKTVGKITGMEAYSHTAYKSALIETVKN